MPKLVSCGNELIRINPAGNKLEYSLTNGRSWSTRYATTSFGTFVDLLLYGNELLLLTGRGIYYSTTQGRSWSSRYISSAFGEFQALVDGGRELLLQTSKGLYYSMTAGRSWSRRN